jgi:transposase
MIGLDTAKSVFHVHAVDAAGKLEMKRKLQRNDLISFFEKQEAASLSLKPAARPTTGPGC